MDNTLLPLLLTLSIAGVGAAAFYWFLFKPGADAEKWIRDNLELCKGYVDEGSIRLGYTKYLGPGSTILFVWFSVEGKRFQLTCKEAREYFEPSIKEYKALDTATRALCNLIGKSMDNETMDPEDEHDQFKEDWFDSLPDSAERKEHAERVSLIRHLNKH